VDAIRDSKWHVKRIQIFIQLDDMGHNWLQEQLCKTVGGFEDVSLSRPFVEFGKRKLYWWSMSIPFIYRELGFSA
jgi:hypothetical protein